MNVETGKIPHTPKMSLYTFFLLDVIVSGLDEQNKFSRKKLKIIKSK